MKYTDENRNKKIFKEFNSRKKGKDPIRDMENRIIVIISLLFVVALVFISASAVNRPQLSNEIPENYYKLSHAYDNEEEYFDKEETKEEKEDVVKLTEPEENEDKAISCWGDSYTVAPDEATASYAGILSQLSGRTVYNIGVPYDSLKAIAGRQGGIPLVTTPFIIPKDKTPVEIAIDSQSGGRQYLDFTKNGGLNPVTINGVDGLISKINDKYYFTREESGESVMVLEPAVIDTAAMELRRGDISVFFIGSDSSVEDPEKMVGIYKSMIQYLEKNNQDYLVVGPVVGDTEELDEVNDKLNLAFGEKYFDLRKFFCEYTDNLYTKNYSLQERKDISEGNIPIRFFNSSQKLYFNQYGAEIAGEGIYEKMRMLGYFKNK